jgi:GT2 family glycosyltransferase
VHEATDALAAQGNSRLGSFTRRLADDVRALLDEAGDEVPLPRLAPPGSARRKLLRAVARRGVQLRRGDRSADPGARRYRQYYAHARPAAFQQSSRAALVDYLESHPLVSVVVSEEGGDLAQTLRCIQAQLYDRVEVLVASRRELPGFAASTVVVAKGTEAERLNATIERATGEYLVCLRAGDLPEPHCVFDLVVGVQDGADAAYGDEDLLDRRGQHTGGHLKPAMFGRETLYSYDVIGAPLLVRTELVRSLGGFDPAAAPVLSHDLSLRLAERTDRITHVAGVLLTRPMSTLADPADATAATVAVVRRAFERIGRHATVEPGEVLPSVRYHVAAPTPEPSVAIVIPTRDRLDLLKACVDSVTQRSTYSNYSIVICDNDSKEEATLRWMKDSGLKIVACPGPFNYARIVNRGVSMTDADYVVTLNNDTTIATPDWLERLVGLCSLDKVGSVGVKLQYPDGRLQHEGVGIIPMPVHISRDANYPTIDRWLTSTRDAAAVTGACQIVRMAAWHELDGLDERLAVAFNDVDFGMRLCASGWRVVYTPEVLVGHRESASRGDLHPPEDEALLIERWDLLGDYVDPSMPSMVHQLTTRIELDVPVPGR